MATRKIWKFELGLSATRQIEVPYGSKVLCVQLQRGVPTMWVDVATAGAPGGYVITTVGTGESIPDNAGIYAGTYQLNNGYLALHVFARQLENG